MFSKYHEKYRAENTKLSKLRGTFNMAKKALGRPQKVTRIFLVQLETDMLANTGKIAKLAN